MRVHVDIGPVIGDKAVADRIPVGRPLNYPVESSGHRGHIGGAVAPDHAGQRAHAGAAAGDVRVLLGRYGIGVGPVGAVVGRTGHGRHGARAVALDHAGQRAHAGAAARYVRVLLGRYGVGVGPIGVVAGRAVHGRHICGAVAPDHAGQRAHAGAAAGDVRVLLGRYGVGVGPVGNIVSRAVHCGGRAGAIAFEHAGQGRGTADRGCRVLVKYAAGSHRRQARARAAVGHAQRAGQLQHARRGERGLGHARAELGAAVHVESSVGRPGPDTCLAGRRRQVNVISHYQAGELHRQGGALYHLAVKGDIAAHHQVRHRVPVVRVVRRAQHQVAAAHVQAGNRVHGANADIAAGVYYQAVQRTGAQYHVAAAAVVGVGLHDSVAVGRQVGGRADRPGAVEGGAVGEDQGIGGGAGKADIALHGQLPVGVHDRSTYAHIAQRRAYEDSRGGVIAGGDPDHAVLYAVIGGVGQRLGLLVHHQGQVGPALGFQA